MATEDGITRCFGVLSSVGVPRPATWADDRGGRAARVAAIGSWMAIFGDVDDQHLQAAVLAWLAGKEARFWPLPGQIREALDRLASAADPSARLLDGDGAWGLLQRLVSRHGSYSPPGTGDQAGVADTVERRLVGRDGSVRIVAIAIEPRWSLHADPRQREALEYGLEAIGGWTAVCARDLDDLAMPAQFRRAYEAHVRRGAEEAPARALLSGLEQRRLAHEPQARIGGWVSA